MAERENFRRRSARDFHDEAGNHLSRVSLLTALAQRQVADHQSEANEAQPQVQTLLQDINSNVQVVREGMRDFIWALDPDNDNAYELGLRLKRFGQELFTHHHADFSTALLSPALRNISLRPDQRRHLVLLFKEAMHNSFKHATDATEVSFSLHADAHTLTAEWRDNGQGFSPQAKADGAGLKNMRARANKIDAQLALNSQEGTLVEVSISTKRGMASE
ncbi:MAG: histidine kinase [Bacteroidota bacterium]